MKTAMYMEDGELQLVFTPQSKFEAEVIKKLQDMDKKQITVSTGSFYECQGGHFRYVDSPPSGDDRSLIIRTTKK